MAMESPRTVVAIMVARALEQVVHHHTALRSHMYSGSLSLAQCLWLVVAAAGAALVLRRARSKRAGARSGLKPLPPGPSKLPVLGNLLTLVSSSNPHQELHRLAQRYGPVMSLRLGSKQALVVSSPEMAKEVLRTLDREFANRPPTATKQTLAYGDYSLGFASYTPHYQFLRKNVTSELFSPKRIQQFASVRAEEASRTMRAILEDSCSECDKQESGPGSAAGPVALDMNKVMFYMVMNIMTVTIASKRYLGAACGNTRAGEPRSCNSSSESDDRSQSIDPNKQTAAVAGHVTAPAGEPEAPGGATDFKTMVEDVFFLAGVTLIGDVIPWLGFLDRIMDYKGAMVRAHKRMDAFLDPLLEAHRHARQQQLLRQGCGAGGVVDRDLVDVLLSLPGNDGAQGLDAITLKAQLFDILGAGVDTVSSTLEWALAELLRRPAAQAAAHAELDAVVGRARTLSEADLPGLPYLAQVVKEVLRLHPPAPLLAPHHNERACSVGGYAVPARTTVLVNVWSIGRSAAAWGGAGAGGHGQVPEESGPDPLQFSPERFAAADAPDVRGHHFQLLPFGSGRRMCPGSLMGLTLLHYCLARLLHAFQWELPPGVTPASLDMAERFGLTLHRASSLFAVPRPRLPRHLY